MYTYSTVHVDNPDAAVDTECGTLEVVVATAVEVPVAYRLPSLEREISPNRRGRSLMSNSKSRNTNSSSRQFVVTFTNLPLFLWLSQPLVWNRCLSIVGFFAIISQFLSFIALVVFAYPFTESYTKTIQPGYQDSVGLLFCLFAFASSTFLVWICALHSSFYRFITHPSAVLKASDYFAKIPTLPMKLVHRVHCYHQTAETDSQGRLNPRMITHTTHHAEEEFHFAHSIDVTEYPAVDFSSSSSSSLSLIHFKKTFQFGDDFTADRFRRESQSFRLLHMHCDTNRTFHEELSMDGLHDEILSYSSEEQIPWMIREEQKSLFLFFTLFFGISWFYYGLFSYRVDSYNVEVNRIVMDH
jgi:hypothetical protein